MLAVTPDALDTSYCYSWNTSHVRAVLMGAPRNTMGASSVRNASVLHRGFCTYSCLTSPLLSGFILSDTLTYLRNLVTLYNLLLCHPHETHGWKTPTSCRTTRDWRSCTQSSALYVVYVVYLCVDLLGLDSGMQVTTDIYDDVERQNSALDNAVSVLVLSFDFNNFLPLFSFPRVPLPINCNSETHSHRLAHRSHNRRDAPAKHSVSLQAESSNGGQLVTARPPS